MQVKFYDNIEDEKLLFAVILTKYNNKWVFCKHKNRDTYETEERATLIGRPFQFVEKLVF